MKLGVLVYLERDGHVLMIHRQKQDEHQGYWLAPGGKLEKNEAPIEAAIREVQEETGLHIPPPQLKGILSFPDQGDSPFGDEWQVFVYYLQNPPGSLRNDCPEGYLAWIPREELLQLPMWEGDRLFTPKVFEPGFFEAKLLYRRDLLTESQFWPNRQ